MANLGGQAWAPPLDDVVAVGRRAARAGGAGERPSPPRQPGKMPRITSFTRRSRLGGACPPPTSPGGRRTPPVPVPTPADAMAAGTSLEWIARLAGSCASGNCPTLVQIGANDGGGGSSKDPAIAAISSGWSALLFEPQPHVFATLAARYRGHAKVRTVNAAVCVGGVPSTRESDSTAGGRHHTCQRRTSAFWHIDLTNATGSWGSNTSDPRCLQGYMGATLRRPWVSEIASFSLGNLLRHNKFFNRTNMHNQCSKCARILGRPLPSNCMQHFLTANVRRIDVPCACLRRELQQLRRVDLLLVDVEGLDADVIEAYPFAMQPPARIIFEAMHLTRERRMELRRFLGRQRYRCIADCAGHLSTWSRSD